MNKQNSTVFNCKPILLIQFRKSPTLEHEQECFLKFLQLTREKFVITNLPNENSFIPKPGDVDKYSGVIIGGSSEFNITDWPEDLSNKAQKLKPFLKKAIEKDLPMLGICFGHQLIAHLFDGKVQRDEKQKEGGIVEVKINKLGKKLKIFQSMPEKFDVVSGHKDCVTKLPAGAIKLASSKQTKIHAYKIKNNIFCVQFHPELDIEGLIWRLSLFPEYQNGRSMDEIKKEFKEMPYSSKVLTNFKSLIK